MSQQYRILVVDDEPINRTLLRGILNEKGFEVLEAGTGEVGIELAASEKPDLIILDVMMPDANGFDVCQQLRSVDETCAIPVVFITVLDSRFSILKALRAGATDYIIKPIESDDVITKVQGLLSTQNLVRDKMNLLKINDAMISRIKSMLGDFAAEEKVDDIKTDLAEKSLSTMDYLNSVRENIEGNQPDQALEALTHAEMSLQFVDRVSQQMNEFAKVLDRIHGIMNQNDDLLSDHALDKASSDSVLQGKVDQTDVDDLLESLIG